MSIIIHSYCWSSSVSVGYLFFLTFISRRVPADEYKCNSTLEDKDGADFKITLGSYMDNEVRAKTIYCDKEYTPRPLNLQ